MRAPKPRPSRCSRTAAWRPSVSTTTSASPSRRSAAATASRAGSRSTRPPGISPRWRGPSTARIRWGGSGGGQRWRPRWASGGIGVAVIDGAELNYRLHRMKFGRNFLFGKVHWVNEFVVRGLASKMRSSRLVPGTAVSMRVRILGVTVARNSACLCAIDEEGRGVRLCPDAAHHLWAAHSVSNFAGGQIWEVDGTVGPRAGGPFSDDVVVRRRLRVEPDSGIAEMRDWLVKQGFIEAGSWRDIFEGKLTISSAGRFHALDNDLPTYTICCWRLPEGFRLARRERLTEDGYDYTIWEGGQTCTIPYIGPDQPPEALDSRFIVGLTLAPNINRFGAKPNIYLKIGAWFHSPSAREGVHSPAPVRPVPVPVRPVPAPLAVGVAEEVQSSVELALVKAIRELLRGDDVPIIVGRYLRRTTALLDRKFDDENWDLCFGGETGRWLTSIMWRCCTPVVLGRLPARMPRFLAFADEIQTALALADEARYGLSAFGPAFTRQFAATSAVMRCNVEEIPDPLPETHRAWRSGSSILLDDASILDPHSDLRVLMDSTGADARRAWIGLWTAVLDAVLPRWAADNGAVLDEMDDDPRRICGQALHAVALTGFDGDADALQWLADDLGDQRMVLVAELLERDGRRGGRGRAGVLAAQAAAAQFSEWVPAVSKWGPPMA